MKKRNHTHSCVTPVPALGEKRFAGKNVSPNHRSVKPSRKTLKAAYNKFYKNQVEALYRAVQGM